MGPLRSLVMYVWCALPCRRGGVSVAGHTRCGALPPDIVAFVAAGVLPPDARCRPHEAGGGALHIKQHIIQNCISSSKSKEYMQSFHIFCSLYAIIPYHVVLYTQTQLIRGGRGVGGVNSHLRPLPRTDEPHSPWSRTRVK